MRSTSAGAESSCRRSTASNRRRGSRDGGRTDTAWTSSGSGRRGAAGPAIYDGRALSRAASALVSLDVGGLRSYFVRGHPQLLAYLLANLGFDVLSHRALVPPGSEPCLGRQSIFQNYPTAAKTTDDGARVG